MNHTISSLRSTQAVEISQFTYDPHTVVSMISIGTKAQPVASWNDAVNVLFDVICAQNAVGSETELPLKDLTGISESDALEITRRACRGFQPGLDHQCDRTVRACVDL